MGYLYQMRGYSNDEVASYLRFNDTINFPPFVQTLDRPGAEQPAPATGKLGVAAIGAARLKA